MRGCGERLNFTSQFMLRWFALPLAVLALVPAQPGAAQVRFGDRTIDLSPYVRYSVPRRYIATPGVSGFFVEVREPGAIRLRHLPESLLDEDGPLTWGSIPNSFPVLDLARVNLDSPRRDPLTGTWTVAIDSLSNERFDVHELLDNGRALHRVTSSGFVQAHTAWGARMAVIERAGSAEPYGRCLSLINLTTGHRARLACADPPNLFDDQLSWRPDGQVLIAAGQLFRIRGDSAVSERGLLQETVVAWVDTVTYLSLRGQGFARRLFEVDATNGTARQLPGLDAFGLLRPDVRAIDGRLLAFLTSGQTLNAVDAETSLPVGRVTLPDGFVPGVFSGRHWVLSRTHPTRPVEYALLTARASGDSLTFRIRALPEDGLAPEACVAERVSYPTFDGTINAYLFSPRRPMPDSADRLGVVEAYYGGRGTYEGAFTLLCEAGVTILSPNIIRFTHGDRGGNEVADVLHGARWLRDRMGVAEHQIGTYGWSQGGYNALRAVTYQPETNGRNISFDFGFAIAIAGYSSMLTILGNTDTESPNIIATGNPATEEGRARLRERSPLDQVERLRASVLLLHGTSDNRVRVIESRQFIRAAQAAGKDVTLVEFAGEGHRVVMEDNLRTFYTAQLEFLERVRAVRRQ